jgi:hypothetical protein
VGTSGSTPLHFAAANGHTTVVSTLLQHGAQPDQPDKHGVTPEMLARENGWLECAALLNDWTLKKEEELRVTEESNNRKKELLNGSGLLERDGSTRHRLRVKGSVDHALNSLKSTLNNRSESHLARTLNASPGPPSPTSKPPDPHPFYASSPHSTDDLSRRPSLPHIYETVPPKLSSRNSRRPQSADNNADHDDHAPRRRLGSKYSLLHMFKRDASPSLTPERLPPSSDSPSPGPTPYTVSASPLAPPRSSSASDSSFLVRTRNRLGSDTSPRTSPPPFPSNAETFHSRDRSASSISKAAPVFEDDEQSNPASPPTRPSPLRAQNSRTSSPFMPSLQSQQIPIPQSSRRTPRSNTSGSIATSPGSRLGTNHFLDRLAPRTGLLPASGKRSRSLLSLRAGEKSIASNAPDSAPAAHNEFRDEIHINVEGDEDEEYGKPVWTSDVGIGRSHLGPLQSNFVRGTSFTSSSSSLSPIRSPDPNSAAEFTFETTQLSTSEETPDGHLVVPSSNGNRVRGNSVSSESTDSSADPQLTMSGTTATSNDSGTITTPSHCIIRPPPPESNTTAMNARKPTLLQECLGDEWAPELLHSTVSERRAHAPLDLDIQSISSHAQAEALVQQTQQSILEMADDPNCASGPAGLGWSPLSAKLAAYGESLALERRLKKEEEDRATTALRNPIRLTEHGISGKQHRSESPSKTKRNLHRKLIPNGGSEPRMCFMCIETIIDVLAAASPVDADLSNRSPLSQQPLSRDRPMYSAGDGDSASSSEVSHPLTPIRVTSPLHSTVHSQTPEPIPAFEDSTDGGPISRVLTAPPAENTSASDERDGARDIASANKLSRMGFATTEGWQPSSTVSSTSSRHASKAKFGLKSLMQTLKGKS